ncbi:Uncharacterised protein [Mycobacterium tuberculosis]|nr:Uncharacterised protein [Mycobacterium tuberculosis]
MNLIFLKSGMRGSSLAFTLLGSWNCLLAAPSSCAAGVSAHS